MLADGGSVAVFAIIPIVGIRRDRALAGSGRRLPGAKFILLLAAANLNALAWTNAWLQPRSDRCGNFGARLAPGRHHAGGDVFIWSPLISLPRRCVTLNMIPGGAGPLFIVWFSYGIFPTS